MKTIKIIDLLVKIANKEEMPEKIKYKEKVYTLEHNQITNMNYYKTKGSPSLLHDIESYDLDKEVEIIEDKIKKIEKIKEEYTTNIISADVNFTIFRKKLNEIIDKLNYLLEKSDKDERS